MLTYSDLVDRLVTFFGGAADDRDQKVCRTAAWEAYRHVCTDPNGWRYYNRKYRIMLVAPYSTGTIAYDNTTRIVTLTTGTFPTWAALGTIQIGNLLHEVETRTDGTHVVLDAANNPGQDVASGTSYIIFQSVYPLPSDFLFMFRPQTENKGWWNWYLEPQQWLSMERNVTSSGTPWAWTIMGNPNKYAYGGMAVCMYPYPSTAATEDLIYKRNPRDIRISGFEASSYTGTISITGSAVTGVGTSFNARMIGSVIRFSEDTTNVPDGYGSLHPYLEEAVITAVADTTHLTINTTPTGTYSGNKFRISDPLDLEQSMYRAVVARAEYDLCDVADQDAKAKGMAFGAYRRELKTALENDQRIPMDRAGIVDSDFGNFNGIGQYGVNYTVTY